MNVDHQIQSARLKYLQAVTNYTGTLTAAEKDRCLLLYAQGWLPATAACDVKVRRLT